MKMRKDDLPTTEARFVEQAGCMKWTSSAADRFDGLNQDAGDAGAGSRVTNFN
jgi:hypothetical protein